MAKKITQKDQAYEKIKWDIIRGEIRPGEILNEIEMANKYEFGKTPTREALLVLAHEKYLRPMPRVGYIVTEPVMKDILEIFQLRTILEGEAIGIAAERMSDATLKELELNNLAEKEIFKIKDTTEMRECGMKLNEEFHLIIARTTGNLRMVEMITQLIHDMTRFVYLDPEVADHTHHKLILTCLQRRDKSGAKDALRQHIDESRKRMLNRV